MKQYHIFISHSWTYNKEYENLKNLLDKDPTFNYRDYSVPESDPIDAENKSQLEEALKRKIQDSSCVLIIAGMYVNYSNWICEEIKMSVNMNKKIIAIQRWGQRKYPSFAEEAADMTVKWNSKSIIKAIRTICD